MYRAQSKNEQGCHNNIYLATGLGRFVLTAAAPKARTTSGVGQTLTSGARVRSGGTTVGSMGPPLNWEGL